MAIGKLLSTIGGTLLKNSPAILTGLGVVGFIRTVVSAVTATPKALLLLEEAREKKGEELTKKEMVKTAWKCYIPSMILGGVSIGCVIGANNISAGRNAALVSLYSLTEKTLKDYKETIIDLVGPEEANKIREMVIEKKIENNPVIDEEIIMTGKGDTLCYDNLAGRYFKSDIEFIKQAINKLGRDMLTEDVVTLNDVYSELGLHQTKLGDIVSWHILDGHFEPKFSSHLSSRGTPCLVLDFYTEPRYDYHNY